MIIDVRRAERRIAAVDQHFAEVVERWQPQLLRHARATIRDGGAAEEAVQDTLVSAWRHLDEFRGDASMRTWLFTILARKIVDHLRRRTPILTADGELDMPCPDVLADPFQAVSAKDFTDALHTNLSRLPHRQRACWLLREVELMTYPEIGMVMDLSEDAARGQVVRARAALRHGLADWR